MLTSYCFNFQSRVVAVIVPEIEAIKEYAAKRQIPNKSFSFLCNQTQIKSLLQSELDKISRLENLKGFETVGSFKLHLVLNFIYYTTSEIKCHIRYLMFYILFITDQADLPPPRSVFIPKWTSKFKWCEKQKEIGAVFQTSN